jgi:hypothetical protein
MRLQGRDAIVLRVRDHLQRHGWPRVQMALMVAATGGVALLSSWALRAAGIEHLGWRYPLSLAVAWLAFLGLLGLWVRWNADDWAQALDAAGEAVDPVSAGLDLAGEALSRTRVPRPDLPWPGGGDFAGGGASADFTVAPQAGGEGLAHTAARSLGEQVGDAVGEVAGDADELVIPLVVVALVAGVAVASLWVVWSAPLLLAELVVDGALSWLLLRRLREQDRAHWFTTAVRRTALPFGLTALLLAVCGSVMHATAPAAGSLGEYVTWMNTPAPATRP